MVKHCRTAWLLRPGILAAAAFLPALLWASDGIKGVRQFNPDNETVELFSAIEEGQLDVRLIPKDSKRCRVLIANKSDRPLNVKMPRAFAGVPVLAQFQDGNFFDNDLDNNLSNANSNGPQTLGIGNRFGNQGNNSGGGPRFNLQGGNNNNFMPFNIAPEKVGQLKLISVCLEHGKAEPRPVMPYKIVPLENVTSKVEVHELCRLLASGEVGQRAAQAAAWHLNNDMTWDQLTNKKFRLMFVGNRPFFSKQELAEAKQAAAKATDLAKQQEKPDQSDSLSMR